MSLIVDANGLKEQANAKFSGFLLPDVSAGHFQEASDLYTAALALQPENEVLWSNRSIAQLRLENYQAALDDATRCVELKPTFAKGYYRKGSALLFLHKYDEALKAFQEVVKAHPKDPDAQKKFRECRAIRQKMLFEAAISYEGGKASVVETVLEKLSSMEVDKSYDGPVLPANGPDAAYMVEMMEYQRAQKNIPQKYVFQILLAAIDILKALPNIVFVDVPENTHITVCGDTHGQYYDLLNIFAINGRPSAQNPYLFNGDYVDRGSFSVEVALTLLAYKVAFPAHVHLTRGNHESKNMNKMYGFEGEVKAKYNELTYELFSAVFNWLPLGYVLKKEVFVVHGGLFSDDESSIETVQKLNRNCEPPERGPMSDLMWSDPSPFAGRTPSKRGTGTAFGPDITERFLERNGLRLLVRSHEVKDEGYLVEHNGKCITIFSAPNYCDQVGNKGAFIRFESSTMNPEFTSYVHVPHPHAPPMKYASQFGMFM